MGGTPGTWGRERKDVCVEWGRRGVGVVEVEAGEWKTERIRIY